jgi:hypothetical protein
VRENEGDNGFGELENEEVEEETMIEERKKRFAVWRSGQGNARGSRPKWELNFAGRGLTGRRMALTQGVTVMTTSNIGTKPLAERGPVIRIGFAVGNFVILSYTKLAAKIDIQSCGWLGAIAVDKVSTETDAQ